MDDECVEELGRPISSLKVSDLRDELAKRALIKTGKKNELVDRLRQAISKQSTSTQPSDADLPADLTVQPGSNIQVESAIDYSTPQNILSNMASSQQQVPMPAADIVDYSATKQSSGQLLPDDGSLILEQQQQEKLTRDQVKKEEEIVQKQLEKEKEAEKLRQQEIEELTKQEELKRQQLELEDKRKEEEVEEQGESKQIREIESVKSQEIEAEIDDSIKEASSEQTDDLANSSQGTKPMDEVDHATRAESKSESNVPITFTLKRGNRDGYSSSKAEKRRKWSGKLSESTQGSDSSLVQGGISSQKLKELIDLKQLESNDVVTKEASPESAESSLDKTDKVKSRTENQAKKAAESLQSTKPVDETDQPNNNSKEVSDPEGNSSITHEPMESKVEEPTSWLMIQNLMRPYTVTQLKEELTKFGPIIEDKFWTDKVKSKCCVLFETVEAAQQTKQSMQGQHWPVSNPKSLLVSFITEDDYKAHIAADISKPSKASKGPEDTGSKTVNGASDKSIKQTNNRPTDQLETADIASSSVQQRLGQKLGGDQSDGKTSRLALGDLQPRELDDFFKKTKAKPQLFWLPLNEEQAEARKSLREERDKRAQETSKNMTSASRRSPKPPPQRRRSPNPTRRSPTRHRSPVTRSPGRRRSPALRSPGRRRSPATRSPGRRRSPAWRRTPPPTSRRSPPRRRPPTSPRGSPPPRRRSPPREHSPLLRRRVSPKDSPPAVRRRTPHRDSPPPFRRRTPLKESPPPMRRRSPSPLLRRRTPPRDSPPIRRRSPEQGRSPIMYRRSPDLLGRSPGPVRRMSPGRRSPGLMRRSPAIMRRSPGLMRRSPGPLRRSPGPLRRSPGPMRRSPGFMRRSPPGPIRRPRGARDYN